MTFVIITGGIDLSVGSTGRTHQRRGGHRAAARAFPGRWSSWHARARRRSSGCVQGWFIAWRGIPAFIVTLAGLSILRGLALYLTQGYSIPINDAPASSASAAASSSAFPFPAILIAVVRSRGSAMR